MLVVVSGFAQTEPTTAVKPAPAIEAPLKDYTSSMIGFSISFPSPVRERAAKGIIENNPAYFFEYVATSADTIFQVTINYLSLNIATPDQTKKRFRDMLEKVKNNPKHKWLSGGDYVLEGNPGIEYKVELIEEKAIVWSRQYFAFGKIYETSVRYPTKQPELKSCTTFMDSLKILRSPYTAETLPLGLIEQIQSPAQPPPAPVQWNEGVERVSGQILVTNAVKKVTPKIPRVGVRGVVQILLVVSEEGKLISATAFGSDEELKKAAVEAVNLWVFQPIQVNGKPMKVQGTIAFKFGE